jgi:hypothetical protein
LADRRTLEITRNQFAAGIAAGSDVVTAETQLQTTQPHLIADTQGRTLNDRNCCGDPQVIGASFGICLIELETLMVTARATRLQGIKVTQ